MSILRNIWHNLDWTILYSVIPALLCITIHEVSHGLMALRLGDDTAKLQGRLTLNPLKHIDPFGLVMMILFRFGWAKPVPVNMYRFRDPKKGMAITALAGPACNLVLSALALFLYGLLYLPLLGTAALEPVSQLLQITAYLSLNLAVFNLIPIPPLDGSKVLFALIPDQSYMKLMRYERYGMLLLLLIVSTDLVGRPLNQITSALYSAFFHIAQWGLDLASIFA